jgi:serine/threonine protein kinase
MNICPYKTYKKIAKGSYGEVFLVSKDNTLYAHKKFLKDKKNKKAYIFNPLEIDIISRLKSPYLIQGEYITLPGECDTQFGFVTKFIEGNLAYDIPYMNFKKRQSIMFDLVKAVKCLHDNNFLHLDIKLDNVKYDGSKVILIDYGMASYVPYNVSYGIETPQPRFTLEFTSPEGLADKDDIYFYNDKNDIWALGITFLEIIANGMIDYIPANLNKKYEYYEKNNSIESFFIELSNYQKIQMNSSNIESFLDKYVFKYCKYKIENKDQLINLIKGMLQINPKERYNIQQIFKHKYFKELKAEYDLNSCEIIKPDNYTLSEKEPLLSGVNDIVKLCKKIIKYESSYILFMAVDIYLRYIARMNEYKEYGSLDIKKSNLIKVCVLISYKYFRWDEFKFDDLIRDLNLNHNNEENLIYKVLEGKIREERYFIHCNNISEVKFLYEHFIRCSKSDKYNPNILNYLNNNGKDFMDLHRIFKGKKDIFNLEISNL